jgi:hypothetical protein
MGVSRDDMGSSVRDPEMSTDTINYRRNIIMRIRLNYLAPLLGAGAVAAAIAAAPIAAADTGMSCAGNVCQSPGNVQINDNPPPVGFYPYGGDAFLLGGGGFGGGFHGGGGHR